MNVEKLTIRQLITRSTPKAFTGAISTIIAAFVAVFGAGYYFAGQLAEIEIKRKDLEIQSFKDKWATIEPQIALERYFDFRKQVISIYNKNIPSQSVLIDGQFLARKDLPGLTYQKMTAIEWQKQIGKTMLSACESKVSDLGPIHIWRGSTIFQVKKPHGFKQDFVGQIAIQKTLKTRLESRMVEFIKCFQTKESELQIGKEVGEQLENFAKNLRRVDLVGFLHAQNELSGYLVAALDPNYEWKSYVVEKQEGYLYSIVVKGQNNIEMLIDNTPTDANKIYERIQ